MYLLLAFSVTDSDRVPTKNPKLITISENATQTKSGECSFENDRSYRI